MFLREKILSFIEEELIGVKHDYPFKDKSICIMRVNKNKKWFGAFHFAPKSKVEVEGDGVTEILSLKCPPELSPLLCAKYRGIVPAYHFNKRHWISVVLSSDISEEDVKELVRLSYYIVAKN